MTTNPEIVLNLSGLGYVWKWRQTLSQARKLVSAPSGAGARMSTRLAGLKPIRQPVFILGCPRSGTTFLGEVLSALPRASYYYEPPVMKYYSRLVYEKRVTPRQAARFYRLGLRALLLAAPGRGPRVIEKNPPHTWIAEDLLRIFPDARFVVISRDGRDVSVSLAEKPWHRRDSLSLGKREPGGYIYGPHPHFYIEKERADEYVATSDIHRCIWIWRRHAEETERLKTALPPGVQFRLRYEELIREPEATLTMLLDFLGENDDESRAQVMAASAQGHDSSIGRWKRKLQKEDLDVIEKEAGKMMSVLGYE